VFGPLVGGIYALGGALLSAAVTYTVGRHIGRQTVRRLSGRQLNRITRRLAKKGVLAIAVIRLLPVAPFSVVNAVIGASHIRFKDFLIGTALGMAPGIAITVIFVDRITAAVTDPGPGTYAALAAVAAILVGVATYVRKRFGDIETGPRPERR
jgi:phospholipase D1/2